MDRAVIVASAALVLSWSGGAGAQDAAEPDADTGEAPVADLDDAPVSEYDVVVVATRSEVPTPPPPLAVSIVEIEPLEDSRTGLSIAEHSLAIPGVLIRNRYNFAQDPRISIRGFGARSAFGVRGVTVLLDGIPLTLADGLAQIDIVEPDVLGRIEALRGPAGALYGNAAGGVLYLETAGADERPGVDVNLRLGSFGFRKLGARAAQPLDSGEVTVYATLLEVDGYRQRSRVEQRTVGGVARWELGDGVELRASGAYLDEPVAEDAGGLTAGELQADPRQAAPNNLMFRTGEAVTQSQLGLALDAELGEHEELWGRAYASGRSYAGSVPFRVIDLDRNAQGVSAGVRSDRALASMPTRLTLALEGSRLADRRISWGNDGGLPTTEPGLNQDESVRAAAVYGQARVQPAPSLGFLAGARYDRVRFELDDDLRTDGDQSGDRTFGAATGMIGVIGTLDPAEIYANFADAFETPTVTELSLRPGGGAGLNQDLDPQRARSLEAGVRIEKDGLRGEATAFAMSLEDELIPFEDQTNRTFYRNAGSSNRLGAELAIAAGLPLGLGVTATYSYLRARFDDYQVGGEDLSGNAVPGIPAHRLTALLGWSGALAGGTLFARMRVEYLHETYADDRNQTLSDRQWPMFLELGYRRPLGPLRTALELGVDNPWNQDYVDNLRINAAGNRYFEPGPTRLLYAALTVGWGESSTSRAP